MYENARIRGNQKALQKIEGLGCSGSKMDLISRSTRIFARILCNTAANIVISQSHGASTDDQDRPGWVFTIRSGRHEGKVKVCSASSQTSETSEFTKLHPEHARTKVRSTITLLLACLSVHRSYSTRVRGVSFGFIGWRGWRVAFVLVAVEFAVDQLEIDVTKRFFAFAACETYTNTRTHTKRHTEGVERQKQ